MTNYRKHVCENCHNAGWMDFASKDNPARDDWCVICEHYGYGLKRDVIIGPWDTFIVPPDNKSDDLIEVNKMIKTKLAEIKIGENETTFIHAKNEDEAKIIEQRSDFVRWASSWLVCPPTLIDQDRDPKYKL